MPPHPIRLATGAPSAMARKPFKPSRAQLIAAAGNAIPDIIAPRLR